MMGTSKLTEQPPSHSLGHAACIARYGFAKEQDSDEVKSVHDEDGDGDVILMVTSKEELARRAAAKEKEIDGRTVIDLNKSKGKTRSHRRRRRRHKSRRRRRRRRRRRSRSRSRSRGHDAESVSNDGSVTTGRDGSRSRRRRRKSRRTLVRERHQERMEDAQVNTARLRRRAERLSRRHASQGGTYVDRAADWKEFSTDDGVAYFYNVYVASVSS